jgi:DNA polymerase-3 subunit alpha
MKIANVLAGYSLGDADNLRRAMGKKIPEVMEEQREKFMLGAEEKNIPADRAKKIFDLMAKFAGYGFNKSHSAAYALIAYQTAYLKAHYPSQFMAALLSCDMNNTDKVVRYISECKEHDIDVLPPDINESYHDFTVINDRIRFGLAAVKNVGGAALDSIIEERDTDGPYKSLGDFCKRVDSRKVNRRVIESLIKAGAFDSLQGKRSQLIAILDQAMDQAQATQRDKESGQLSLFSLMPEETQEKSSNIPMPDILEWDKKERLQYEKETVGFYITGHPLDDFREELKQVAYNQITSLNECGDGAAVRIGGLVKTKKELKSKKGDAMAFLSMEDTTGSVEVIAFPSVFSNCFHLLNEDNTIIVQGVLQKEEEGGFKILAEHIDSLEDAQLKYTTGTKIELISDKVSRQKIETLKKVIHQNHGPCPVSLTLHFAKRGEADIDIPEDLTINPCVQFLKTVDETLGYDGVSYIMQKPEIMNRQKRNTARN